MICNRPKRVDRIIAFGSIESRDALTMQAMIERAPFAPQPNAEAAPSPWIIGIYPPAFASSRQPELLVGIVASAEGDLTRAVVRQHALDHLHGEEGTERQIVKPLVVRELVNDGTAMPHDPELRRSWDPVDVVDAEAQRPELRGKPDQHRNELREGLSRFPTRRIDRLVIGNCLLDSRCVRKEGFRQAVAMVDPSLFSPPSVAQFHGRAAT